jgi:hypothetical protein
LIREVATNLNKTQLRDIRTDINAALVGVAQKHGLGTLKCGNGSFGDSFFTFKVEGVVAGGKNKDGDRYDEAREVLNLPPLGAEFKFHGVDYRTVGINTTLTKVKVDRVKDGAPFLMTVDFVIRMYASKMRLEN